MNLEQMITVAYNTKWTKINDFSINFNINSSAAAGKEANGNNLMNIFSNIGIDEVMLNLALISCEVPPLNIQSHETYLGGRWFYTNGKPDMAKVTLTFRDYNELKIYTTFAKIFENSLGQFTDQHKMSLQVFLDSDEGRKQVFQFNDAIIENVSQLSFSNTTENQIAEFSVTIRGIRQTINSVKTFKADTSSFEDSRMGQEGSKLPSTPSTKSLMSKFGA